MDQAVPRLGPKGPSPRLSDDEQREMRADALAQSPYADEFWIFGFGSLMWNPGVNHVEARVAKVHGFERKFHIWSSVGRGTPEQPGLGLCLEETGGTCRGRAFSLPMETLDAELDYIWDREMGSGIYIPTWVPLTLECGEPTQKLALSFVVNRDHVQYAGPMPAEQMAQVMSGACGKYGRCRDYLANTLAEMAKLGERDPLLEDVLARIDETTS